MANYGTKYRYKYLSGDGQTVEVQIQQDGYSSTVTELTAAPNGITATWGQQGGDDLTTPLDISTTTLRFIGDSNAETLLDEVFDSPDTEYRARLFVGGSLEWQGFLATDLRRYNPYVESEVVRLEALDGLALLENRDAADANEEVSTILSQILRGDSDAGIEGLHNIPIYTSMDWHSHDASVSDGQCPLDVYAVGSKSYKKLDDTREVESSLDQRAQLEDFLERFGLRLTLAEGAWHLRQRDQIDDGTQLKRWQVDTTGNDFGFSSSIDDVTASLPPAARTERPVSGVQRLRSVKSTYSYDDLSVRETRRRVGGPH